MNRRHFGLLLLNAPLLAADQARDLVAEAQKRTDSKSMHYEGLLQVVDASRKVTEKRWTLDRIGAHGNSKTMLRFQVPPEVKGVALLTVNHPDRASTQEIYFPSQGRTRAINVQDRSNRFLGTDFTFEDLEERDVDQYDYKLSGEEPIDGAVCWKIESTPKKNKSSQYTNSFVWIRKDNYAFAQIESYNKSQLIRKLLHKDIEKVQGIWTAKTLDMYDVKRNSHTLLKLDKLQYNIPMSEDRFTRDALVREG